MICYYSYPGVSANAIVRLPSAARGTTLQSATFKCNVIETLLRPWHSGMGWDGGGAISKKIHHLTESFCMGEKQKCLLHQVTDDAQEMNLQPRQMAFWGPYRGDVITKEVSVTVCLIASLKLSGELLFVCAAACPDSFLWGKSAYVPLAFLLLNANLFAGSPLSYAVPSIPSATELWLAWVSEYTQNTPQPAIWMSTHHNSICPSNGQFSQSEGPHRKNASMRVAVFLYCTVRATHQTEAEKTDKDERSLRNESPLLAGSSLRWKSRHPEFILKRRENLLVIPRILPAVLQQIRAQEARWWCVIFTQQHNASGWVR